MNFKEEGLLKLLNFIQSRVKFSRYFKIVLMHFILFCVYIPGTYAQQENLSIWLWNSDKRENAAIQVGDTLELEVWMNVGSLNVQGVSFYISFDDKYFKAVNLKGSDIVFKPFDFNGGMFPPGNITDNSVYVDSGNVIPGFQIDGAIMLGKDQSVTGQGKIARFQLIAADKVDSAKITIDYDRHNHRDTRYHKTDLSEDQYNFIYNFTVNINEISLAVDRGNIINIADDFSLFQNFPNPFNPETNIKFQLPRASKVTMKIYNILGQEIKTIVNRNLNAGFHLVKWDGTDNLGLNVGSGVYIYVIEAGNFIDSRKMLLLR